MTFLWTNYNIITVKLKNSKTIDDELGRRSDSAVSVRRTDELVYVDDHTQIKGSSMADNGGDCGVCISVRQ